MVVFMLFKIIAQGRKSHSVRYDRCLVAFDGDPRIRGEEGCCSVKGAEAVPTIIESQVKLIAI